MKPELELLFVPNPKSPADDPPPLVKLGGPPPNGTSAEGVEATEAALRGAAVGGVVPPERDPELTLGLLADCIFASSILKKMQPYYGHYQVTLSKQLSRKR